MKTRRTIQLLHVRDSIKSIPNCAGLSFYELFDKLKDRIKVEGVSPERYTAMVLSFAKGHTSWEDSLEDWG
jgi:hypothetical protein